MQGKFDRLFSGGAICHINVNEKVTNWKLIADLIEYAISCGVIYFAINYELKQCVTGHLWIDGDKCSICGKPIHRIFTRVVGFLTCVENWNKVRREEDYPNRQFYSSVKV